ncbi:hypothetical protein ACFY5C_31795 [Streptomyces sp. NPDC012935]|uniref:hypothetical protein n=1 Tax=Streptomyces sp. NPDC012935 TaxID=3364857 RepID=UPI0036B13A48
MDERRAGPNSLGSTAGRDTRHITKAVGRETVLQKAAEPGTRERRVVPRVPAQRGDRQTGTQAVSRTATGSEPDAGTETARDVDSGSAYVTVAQFVRARRADLAERAASRVPVSRLRSADSPRLKGEDLAYARQLAESGVVFPPILVHRPTMRVIDGMHRLRATVLRGQEHVDVHFFDGCQDSLFALSVGLNAANGRPLSRADRTAAAARLLVSHPQWSDRHVAELTGLAPGTVASLRTTEDIEQLNSRVGKDGRTRPVDAARGRIDAQRIIVSRPASTLREIAKAAGISVATAKDVRDRVRQGEDPLPPRLRAAAAPEPVRTAAAETPRPSATGRVDVQLPAIEAKLLSLSRDPSMRTDAGRLLLQLLRGHLLEDEQKRRWLMERVPEHCRAAVAVAARTCAEQWLRFAAEIEA